MPFVFSQRSKRNLKGVHPYLVEIAYEMLNRAPYDFIVTEGVRTLESQRQMVAKGASQTMKSYHLIQADGYGHAIDVALILPNGGGVTWDNKYYVEFAKVFLQVAEEMKHKITWGGSWKSLYDTPHFQLEPRSIPV